MFVNSGSSACLLAIAALNLPKGSKIITPACTFSTTLAPILQLGYKPVFITSATIRPYFHRLINSSFQNVTVLSYTELPSQIEIEFIDNLEITNAN